MKTYNLQHIIERDENLVIAELTKVGYRLVDDTYLEYGEFGEKNFHSVVLCPEILSHGYRVDEKSEIRDVTLLWICIRIEMEQKEEKERIRLLKFLLEKVKKTNYHPFHDEDAFLGYFRDTEKKDYFKYEMFVNPALPKGWFENHCLE